MKILGDKIRGVFKHLNNLDYIINLAPALSELDKLVAEAELWKAIRLSALKNTITYFVGYQCFVVENYGTDKERNVPLLEWYREQLEKGDR